MSHRVLLLETGTAFEARRDESLLEAATRQGVRLPHACTLGGCGACRIRLLEGRVAYEEMPMALSEEEAQAGFALACQARACTDLAVSVPGDAAPPTQRCNGVVRSVRPFTPDVLNLQLEIEAESVDYLPGQYMNVLLPGGGHRSFSMASPPAGNQVDFHVRRVPGGRFTDGTLGGLRTGDRLALEIPLGSFRYREEDYRPLLMVATGTGLAPLKSMLEALMDEDSPPVSLYWGMRTEEDLYLADQIRSWGERLDEFNFVPVLSRGGAAWSGRRGHVQDAVEQDWADLSEHAIYLCGSPAMIADAKQRFLCRGASAAHVYADGFSFQHEAALA